MTNACKKSKSKVIFNVGVHKDLVGEGILIVTIVNVATESKHPPFVVIGDPKVEGMKNYWFKVKYNYCGDFFQLCLVKK